MSNLKISPISEKIRFTFNDQYVVTINHPYTIFPNWFPIPLYHDNISFIFLHDIYFHQYPDPELFKNCSLEQKEIILSLDEFIARGIQYRFLSRYDENNVRIWFNNRFNDDLAFHKVKNQNFKYFTDCFKHVFVEDLKSQVLNSKLLSLKQRLLQNFEKNPTWINAPKKSRKNVFELAWKFFIAGFNLLNWKEIKSLYRSLCTFHAACDHFKLYKTVENLQEEWNMGHVEAVEMRWNEINHIFDDKNEEVIQKRFHYENPFNKEYSFNWKPSLFFNKTNPL